MEAIIMRANKLKKGDRFRKQSVYHIVVAIERGVIKCRHFSATNGGYSGTGGAIIGKFSQERVELIINL